MQFGIENGELENQIAPNKRSASERFELKCLERRFVRTVELRVGAIPACGLRLDAITQIVTEHTTALLPIKK